MITKEGIKDFTTREVERQHMWARMNRAAIFPVRASQPCFNKKRAYKNEVREMLKKGKMNDERGSWVNVPSTTRFPSCSALHSAR